MSKPAVRRRLLIVSLWLLALLAAAPPCLAQAPSPTPSPSPTPRPEHKFANFTERATNPLSMLGRAFVQENFTPSYQGEKGNGNEVWLRAVIPVPYPHAKESGQLIRVGLPIKSQTGHATTLGDVEAFDLFTTDTPDCLYGVGAVTVLPTAGSEHNGSGKWQIGPAAGMYWTGIPHWQMGFLAQNPISVAGDPKRKPVNQLWFQPHFLVDVGQGWYFVSDAQMTFDWQNNARDIPVNIGVGRVWEKQNINCNIEYEVCAYRKNMTAANNTIRLKFIYLFP